MERDYTKILQVLVVTWLIIGLLALAVWIFGQLLDIILVFIVALLIAAAFSPSIRWLESRLPSRVPRVVTVLVVYMVGISTIGAVFAALSLPLISQAQELAEQAPDLIRKAPQAIPYVEGLAASIGIQLDTGSLLQSFTAQLQSVSTAVLRGLGAGIVAVTSAVGQLVIATIISIYLLLSASDFKRRLSDFLPKAHHDDVMALTTRLGDIATSFIRGQFLLALSIGIPVGIFTFFIGLPFSALLGVFSGLAEFIPVVGSILGAIPAVLVAFAVGGPQLALVVIIFFVILNQLENTVIQPRIVGGQLGLHPVTSILALAIGYKFFGVWGAILGAPAAAVLWALANQAIVTWRKVTGHDDDDETGVEDQEEVISSPEPISEPEA